MGYAKINIWIRERTTCSVSVVKGEFTVAQCCGKVVAEGKIANGHGEATVPPGCYIIAAKYGGRPVTTSEIMVIVGCDKSACINFLIKEK